MDRRRDRRIRSAMACLALGAALVPGCAGRSAPPLDADKEEEALLRRVKAYDDPMLEAYLGRIGDRLTPVGFKFVVLRDPTLNAFAMPSRKIYVHTGLLARVENEAQLVTVLGHEMTHTLDQHAPGLPRDSQARPIPVTALSPTAGAILGLGLRLATVAAISGYSRDLERAADARGILLMVAAGYDAREAPRVFAILLHEAKDGGSLEVFFFGNQPKLQERIDTASELLRTTYAGGLPTQARRRDTEEFQLRMRTVVRDNAYEELRAGRFAQAKAQLDRVLTITPDDALAHLYYGDLYRLQAQRAREAAEKDTLARKALGEYELAAQLDRALADPYRQLGFLYFQQKNNTKAKEAFEKYLALKPDAPDAQRVREYVLGLDR